MLSSTELQLGRGETIEDTGRVLSRYVDAIVLRTFEQERLEVLAGAADVPGGQRPVGLRAPVPGARRPADGPGAARAPRRAHLTYLGDGNNVAHSLLLGRREGGHAGAGGDPAGVRADPAGGAAGRRDRGRDRRRGRVLHDPIEAARGADVLYTDVWASMGQEAEADERALVFPRLPARRDAGRRGQADDVTVLHCLPAHRGQEITDEVIDGPHSAVWDQAENRMHTQKALLLWLLGVG